MSYKRVRHDIDYLMSMKLKSRLFRKTCCPVWIKPPAGLYICAYKKNITIYLTHYGIQDMRPAR